MYTYGEPNAQTRIEQHGDFVLIKKDWCPQLAKITSTVCNTAYTPTEMQVSFTDAGHLTPDVVIIPAGLPAPGVKITCQYLVIRDFGVDWRHIKEPTKADPTLRAWLTRFETDKSLLFRIVGYSDCIGTPVKNTFLRKGRAFNVRELFGPSARSRIMFFGGAPLDTFLTDNSTVGGRANNRSVVIEFFINGATVI